MLSEEQSFSHRVVLFANTDWYLYNFRSGLARSLKDRGHQVTMVSPDGPYAERLDKEFGWRELDLSGGSKNPLDNLAALNRIRSLYREIKPDLVHHFTIKCVLYGGLVARQMKIPTVQAVTGLGHIFTEDSLPNRLIRAGIRPMYQRALGGENTRVIFQNTGDRDFFLNAGLVSEKHLELIRGSGADCDRFRPPSGERRPGPCRFLFASRLIREKGVYELLEAAKHLKASGEPFELMVAGDLYPGNPSSLSSTELEEMKQHVTYLGHVDDMEPHFHDADVVVLPTYAEGTPRVLLEAGACRKPLIGTDIPGCRGVVEDGVNGFLVPAKAVPPLVDAMRKLSGDSSLRQTFGRASRQIIEQGFSETEVIRKTIDVYRKVLPSI
ncbi:glycosyltransferase family 4 protein [Rhodopirellula halodulae]|uniref:glycosyltransferase family 4 protein n=1 Tax=Rhodopirellula halodulae TaxID=2894198 RepID=UPI001E29195C|nr:glycosyltransferase family 4 protein [Rhodopirellula sp. JC737]MCC9655661.1 glycosyltransferase family 4 protein [Rhodopirellula sp. JC737]